VARSVAQVGFEKAKGEKELASAQIKKGQQRIVMGSLHIEEPTKPVRGAFSFDDAVQAAPANAAIRCVLMRQR
jgi:hypothetical protein